MVKDCANTLVIPTEADFHPTAMPSTLSWSTPIRPVLLTMTGPPGAVLEKARRTNAEAGSQSNGVKVQPTASTFFMLRCMPSTLS